MRSGLSVDTSALIAFANPDDLRHESMMAYVQQAISDGVPLYISTLVLAEFTCRQSAEDIDRRTFIVLPFEEPDALLTGELDPEVSRDAGDDRVRLKVDLMLIAQAQKQNIAGILTADADTLARYCDRLRNRNLVDVFPILIDEPFDPARVLNPAVRTFAMPPPTDH